ncbi:uncharacterized protein EI90DRAFT_3013814 [Cantharellus anzutake]|uniref:uncharacterized protein n=1 Tax=Cantharellus anzutake TaxID=1750568 RepID=UPI0019034C66|nr:uncharacterized protein EI90DRAFT_3013814 [Cantharellus anzutake]KAF8337647.1 hypothetical protein EI90DRAFT_3013814 [Cantharellus anzutake]
MAHPLRTMHTVTAAYCVIELTSSLGQSNLSTVISHRPLELAHLLESYSSAVVHPLTLAYRQMNLLADPLRCPTESAYLRETDYSGVGESNKDHLAVLTSCVLEPGCSHHLYHSALTSRPIVTNHIRLSCQAVKPTPLSTLVGLLTVSMHSLLEAAHWQWSHHLVSAHTLIKTRPASTLHCADESTSSYNWLDLRAVPTCQLPEPAYLHGLCCSPVAHLLISARFTRMTRQASEPEFTHVHSGPLADAGYHLLEPALSYGSHVVCTSSATHPIRSAQRTVKPPFHDQSDPPVVPVHCPLDLACTMIHHEVELSSPFGLSDFSAIPAPYSLEQVPSRVWTQPELELSHMEPLRASLSMSCPKSLKRIYTISLCLEMTGTMQAPPWHHPCETQYPPDVVHPTSWQSSSVVFIQVVWSATRRTRPRVDLGRALIPRWWSQVIPSLANYVPRGVVRIQGHDHPHGIYKHGNSSIMIQVASFPAGRLNATPCYHKNPSSDRKTVAMTRPESSQWHLFQANCLCISVSSTTPRSTAASSDQSNPIVLPHPLRWSNHLIKRGNPLPSPVHSVFPVSYCVVGLSRLTSEPMQSFRVLAHSPSIQSRRSSVGEEELSPRDSMTGFSENQSLRQRTAPKGTCIKQVVGKVLSSYSLNTEDERFNLASVAGMGVKAHSVVMVYRKLPITILDSDLHASGCGGELSVPATDFSSVGYPRSANQILPAIRIRLIEFQAVDRHPLRDLREANPLRFHVSITTSSKPSIVTPSGIPGRESTSHSLFPHTPCPHWSFHHVDSMKRASRRTRCAQGSPIGLNFDLDRGAYDGRLTRKLIEAYSLEPRLWHTLNALVSRDPTSPGEDCLLSLLLSANSQCLVIPAANRAKNGVSDRYSAPAGRRSYATFVIFAWSTSTRDDTLTWIVLDAVPGATVDSSRRWFPPQRTQRFRLLGCQTTSPQPPRFRPWLSTMDNGPKQLGSVSTAMELWTLLAATPGSALLPVVSKPHGPKATSTPGGPGSSTTQQHRPQQDHPPYYTLGGVHHYAAMISRIDPTPGLDTRYRATLMTQGGLPVGKRLPKSMGKN